jgi:hypothetical protein
MIADRRWCVGLQSRGEKAEGVGAAEQQLYTVVKRCVAARGLDLIRIGSVRHEAQDRGNKLRWGSTGERRVRGRLGEMKWSSTRGFEKCSRIARVTVIVVQTIELGTTYSEELGS